ncbi:MAG: NADH:flavin oxidoreductase [Bacteroidetes bacterium]|nr:NADH:flavin oxidoreductase [Bacteroidota bacterium]
MNSSLFTEAKIGSVVLRNRSIRAAAFEGMCPGNKVSDDLIRYHTAVSAGGIGMTTVAYASVSRSGLSFPHQLLLNSEAIPELQRLTDSIHREGAAASIQIGHCGQMANTKISGICFAPTGGFNLYGPTLPKTMSFEEIRETVIDFGKAVQIAIDSGFDAVEVHAGHGYLISQFLSPFTNKRKDQYGGIFENRCRFMIEVIREVMKTAGQKIAVIVKMNLRDGFRGGMELDEAIKVAGILENNGVKALVLSGGFVSRTPMYVMRGAMPIGIMAQGMKNFWMRAGTGLFGKYLMKPMTFREGYFMEDALKVRASVKIPLVFVGGVKSLKTIEDVLTKGFDFIQIARALIHDPAFINKIKSGELTQSGCMTSNYCIARMYSGKMSCFQSDDNTPAKWANEFCRKRNGS